MFPLRLFRNYKRIHLKIPDIRTLFSSTNLLVPQQSPDINLDDDRIRVYLEELRREFYNLQASQTSEEKEIRRMRSLSEIVGACEQRNVLLSNLDSLKDIENEKDKDMQDLVMEEKKVYKGLLDRVESSLTESLLNALNTEQYSSVYLEVSAGVGGQEAMLFARQIFDMYHNYLEFKGWEFEVLHYDDSDLGGLRHATLLVSDRNAYNALHLEAGVHRVQRVPTTEKSGRMHTSTVSVAIIPRPDDINIELKEKDLKIETKRASGAGGQHVNTTDSAVRIVHLPTGIAVECQTERSQIKNRELALKKLQSVLYKREAEVQETNKTTTKKSQVGTSNRNEKIRTYNFTQDRVTDHRIQEGGTTHNLEAFLDGGLKLDEFIRNLNNEKRKEHFLNLIKEVKIDSNR